LEKIVTLRSPEFGGFRLFTLGLFTHKLYYLSSCSERTLWKRTCFFVKKQVIASKDAEKNHISHVFSGLDRNCQIEIRVQ